MTISAEPIREVALAKVRAEKAYNEILYRSRDGLTEDQLVDREIELAIARKALFVATTDLTAVLS